jgi:hypothetical protein
MQEDAIDRDQNRDFFGPLQKIAIWFDWIKGGWMEINLDPRSKGKELEINRQSGAPNPHQTPQTPPPRMAPSRNRGKKGKVRKVQRARGNRGISCLERKPPPRPREEGAAVLPPPTPGRRREKTKATPSGRREKGDHHRTGRVK